MTETRSAGTDGAWVGLREAQPASGFMLTTGITSSPGAEHRPCGPTRTPWIKHGMKLIPFVGVAAIVALLDRGNAGGAIIVAMWLLGWTVRK